MFKLLQKLSSYQHLKYAIRLPTRWNSWMTERLYSDSKSSRVESLYSFEPPKYPFEPPYYDECFLLLQNKIDRAFINHSKLPNVQLNAYPYPEVTTNEFSKYVKMALPVVFVFSMILSIKNIIKVSIKAVI